MVLWRHHRDGLNQLARRTDRYAGLGQAEKSCCALRALATQHRVGVGDGSTATPDLALGGRQITEQLTRPSTRSTAGRAAPLEASGPRGVTQGGYMSTAVPGGPRGGCRGVVRGWDP